VSRADPLRPDPVAPDDRQYAPNFLLVLFSNPLDPGYADAAAARARYGPKPRWSRVAGAIARTVTLVVVGFLLAIAYRAAVADEPERTRAHAGLVQEVKTGQASTDELQARADALRGQVTDAQAQALGGGPAELRALREQQAAVGLVAVTGPGVVVRASDAPALIDPTTGKASGAEVSRVLDVDVQSIVNGLWATGAEAIAINGQRLTSTSTIRTAGNTVLVDFRPVTSPYEVSAIGPAEMEKDFKNSAAAAAMNDLANKYAIGFSTHTERSLTLPAAPGAPLAYAHPVTESGAPR
jgi:uncharacterized protein YlxW (UPF0749 family)